MTRRASRLTTVLAVAACGLLASCGAVSSPSDAFSVDGASYSRDDVNGLLVALSALQELNVRDGAASAKDVAEVVSVMVQYRAGAAVLDRWGTPVSDADRKELETKLLPSLPAEISDTVKRLLIDINATGRAVGAVKAPPAADVESMYAASPASTGHLCVRLATLKDEKSARAMIDAVNEGAGFAALATKSGAANGGAVEGGSNCVPVSSRISRVRGRWRRCWTHRSDGRRRRSRTRRAGTSRSTARSTRSSPISSPSSRPTLASTSRTVCSPLPMCA